MSTNGIDAQTAEVPRSRLDDLRAMPKAVQHVIGMEMKKTDPRWNDTRVIKSSGNVFVDLGFDPAEAEVMALRVEVMVRLRKRLAEEGLTQSQAAKQLGITQPRVSALVKGVWKDFSLDMLLTLAARAGLHPKLRLAA
jgi:predicted XRE-type DNA-binding protein